MEPYAAFSEDLKGALELEYPPIAISFSNEPPVGVERLKGGLRLCQMLDKVRFEGAVFYTTTENHACDGGSSSCGLKEINERIKTGEFLCKMGLFSTKRAARRFAKANPRIDPGTVKIVSFSPLEKATFEPDVVALICNARQAMRVAEAYGYDTGKRATGLTGSPICSSIVAAPFLTGEIIYSLGDHGARNYMNIRDEDIFVGIPAELLGQIVGNLGEMEFST